jgi:hypothetical protein
MQPAGSFIKIATTLVYGERLVLKEVEGVRVTMM